MPLVVPIHTSGILAPAGVIDVIYQGTTSLPFSAGYGGVSDPAPSSLGAAAGDKLILATMGFTTLLTSDLTIVDGLGFSTGDTFGVIATGSEWQVFGSDLANAAFDVDINVPGYNPFRILVCAWVLRNARPGFGAASVDYCQFDTTVGALGVPVEGHSLGPGAALQWDNEAVLWAIGGDSPTSISITTDSPWTATGEGGAASGFHGASGFLNPYASLPAAGAMPSVPLHGPSSWGTCENFLLALRGLGG